MLRLGWIGSATWIALETGRAEPVDFPTLEIAKERSVGKTKLTLLRLGM